MSTFHDLIGVGFGPGNLALAIALEELLPAVQARFIEAKARANWQEGMMLHRSNIQHHPSIDLVTPRNPRSKYTFNNYLFENDLLFKHFNLGLEYPLRKEYARYVQWAAQGFDAIVDYGQHVAEIALVGPAAQPTGYRVRTRDGGELLGRGLVLATGRSEYVPAPFDELVGERVFHLNRYLPRIERLVAEGARRIAVIGASQSAVEILLDLCQRFPQVEPVCYLRHFGFRLKDTNPFMEASVHPEHVEPFYFASEQDKARINADLKYLNYSASDLDVLKDLYLTLYEHELDGARRVTLMNNRTIREASRDGGQIRIVADPIYQGARDVRHVDAVVLATGFRDLGPSPHQERVPPLLEPIAEHLRHDERGVLHVNFDYSLSAADESVRLPPLFLNGLCEASHGVSDAGSFSLLSLRAGKLTHAIARALKTPRDIVRPSDSVRAVDARQGRGHG
ncbi:lysine N(6)-hydroxylase/L-ornithine N(5)-oxygenase family protein [Haliangium ochraceum]|uniref:Lysine N6-hydroxylase/L-ornithine N5-oxygenase family protein n=1 Tax=Haliangium ochraceum (strain DSM 14365 / JCM 11303 / SMP-2) TaxID=502025 RepID=D0LMF0_HALO1|nr:SidA/IucD/PvdA family monooxygenase [Haliangium ochraceum]ACY16856.1 lysine N6-hydroxylase/L-ornithine N5-oxygenase family protein [Haliangium ochraceum DSM 14365]